MTRPLGWIAALPLMVVGLPCTLLGRRLTASNAPPGICGHQTPQCAPVSARRRI